ncbi:hypothetical protein D3C72_893350 [compost metagenome]
MAVGVYFVGRGEAGEALRSGAGVGVQFTRVLVPLLATVLTAEGQRDRIGQAPVQRLGQVGVEDVLLVLQRTVVERTRAGRAQAVVDAVAGVEIQGVLAVVQAQVPGPAVVGVAFDAGHQRAVLGVLVDLRHVAVRVGLRQQRALPTVVARTVERERGDVAVAEQRARIAGHVVAEVIAGVDRGSGGVDLRVADDEGGLADAGEIAGVRRGAAVRAGAVALVLLADLAGHMHAATAIGEADAGVAGELVLVAVAGRILAVVDGQAAATATALQHDVDDAGDGIRTVLCGGAVTQHLDALDGGDRNRVDVHRRRTTADAAVDVDHRRGVAALAVDQHQHLVRRQAAQLRRTDVVGTAGVGLAREVERGQQRLQRAAQLAIDHAGLADVLGGQHVHRRSGFKHGAVGGAGAGDDHRVQVGGGVLGRSQGGGQGERDGEAERRRGQAGGHADSSSNDVGKGRGR